MPDTIEIKVISLKDCEATSKTLELLDEIIKEIDAAVTVKHVIVRTQKEANKYRHIGSPTVLIDGVDIDSGARSSLQFGLS